MKTGELLLPPYEVVDTGVDWITCTVLREMEDTRLRTRAFDLLETEESAGNICTAWKHRGYKGYQAGGVRVGVRHDSWIVQLSAEVARDHWREVWNFSTNVTRLDTQITVEFDEPQPHIIKLLHSDALSHRNTAGRPSNRTLITSTLTGDTMMIGQRVSDVYLRAYDKGMEQRTHPPGTRLRYEVETKGKRARQLATRLDEHTTAQSIAANYTATAFRSQSVRVPGNFCEQRLDASSLPASDSSRKLLWVRKSVAPTIAFLLKHVERDKILDALGLRSE